MLMTVCCKVRMHPVNEKIRTCNRWKGVLRMPSRAFRSWYQRAARWFGKGSIDGLTGTIRSSNGC